MNRLCLVIVRDQLEETSEREEREREREREREGEGEEGERGLRILVSSFP